MSLINQVLNELEKRGADAPLGGATIRAVPVREKRRWLPLLLLGVLGLLAILAWLKWHVEGDAPALERTPAMPVPMSGGVLAPSATVAAAAEPASAVDVSDAAAYSSALGMSYELSTLPPPGSLHGKPLLEMAQEERVAEPEEKKVIPHERAVNKAAEKSEKPATENPVNLQLKKISPQQHAENEFRKANLALQEGRVDDALAGYDGVLRAYPLHHAARRALAGALLGLKRNADAERVLQEGLKLDAHEASLAMLLARIQVERDAVPLALETLQKTLQYAEGQADYQAFVAALLQRQSRHKEAITHFQIALQLVPNNGVWWMGVGISMQAVQRNEDARDAYQRALDSNGLNAQLQAYVQKKLKEL